MILQIYTIIHTLISLVAIFTGFVVVFGMLADKRLDGWTKWFLVTAVATTITGFFFPFHGFTPAIGLGIISLPFLALTIFARYPKHLAGPWRWIYVIGGVICLYFNLFVAVVQAFEKIPALHAMAPRRPSPHSNSHSSSSYWCPPSSQSLQRSAFIPRQSARSESETYEEKELTLPKGMFGASVTCFPFFLAKG
jgi:hypothetical protein